MAAASTIPLVEEQLIVEKRATATTTRVTTHVDEHQVVTRQALLKGAVEVERVAFDVEVAVAPIVREDGDLLVVPIVEERMVKRLFLIEEVRMRRTSHIEQIALPVTLRTMRATVEATPRGPVSYPAPRDEIAEPSGVDARPSNSVTSMEGQ